MDGEAQGRAMGKRRGFWPGRGGRVDGGGGLRQVRASCWERGACQVRWTWGGQEADWTLEAPAGSWGPRRISPSLPHLNPLSSASDPQVLVS